MNVPLAWRHALDNKIRTVLAAAGVGAALLLIYMQVCFYDTGLRSSSLFYDQLDFDLILVSPEYVNLRYAGHIARAYLEQAKQSAGMADAVPLSIGSGDFRQQGHGTRYEVMIVGVDAATQPFRVPSLRGKLPRLRLPETAIFDQVMVGPDRPAIRAGDLLEADGRRVRIVDTYLHGPGLIADAEMIVSEETMSTIFPAFKTSSPSLGLLRLKPGADPLRIARELRTLLPSQVNVWTREQVKAADENFLMRRKPLGTFFLAGIVLGLTVGTVVVYQVLEAAVITASAEYAAMRAIGYGKIQIQAIVFQQSLLFVVLALPPATGLAYLLNRFLKSSTHWPFELTGQTVLFVSFLAMMLCGMSGVLVIGKLQRTDPADLFT